MIIKVDLNICERNGLCVGIAPVVFHLDKDQDLQVLLKEVPAEIFSEVRKAAKSCPTSAILLID